MAVMKGAHDMAKLLIADDLVPIRQMVRITLSTQGWTILEAENGQKALELARSVGIECYCLTDLGFERA
jgi:CheY-like chemotaxis protein